MLQRDDECDIKAMMMRCLHPDKYHRDFLFFPWLSLRFFIRAAYIVAGHCVSVVVLCCWAASERLSCSPSKLFFGCWCVLGVVELGRCTCLFSTRMYLGCFLIGQVYLFV